MGRRGSGSQLLLDGLGDGVDAAEDFLGSFRVPDFQAEAFIEGHDELQGVDRVEAEAAGAEERQVIGNFTRCDLQHQVFDHEGLDLLLQSIRVFHAQKVYLRFLTLSL